MKFIIIYLATSLIAFIVSSTIVILEKKRPEKTIAWILLLLVFPPIGLILYLFLGKNWKVNNKLNKEICTRIRELINPIIYKKDFKEYRCLMELLAINSYSPIFINNKVTVFKDGIETFTEMKKRLLQAKHHIHLEYYIVKDDSLGNEIKDILIQKAKEGVKIRFVIDKIGSIKLKKTYIKDLKAAGIDVIFYTYILAPIIRIINTQVNYRNHRKITVIDGFIGFIGGMNISDDYIGKGRLGPWEDAHIMVQGDFVLGLQSVFLDDYSATKKNFNQNDFFTDDIYDYFKPKSTTGNVTMQLIKSGPDSEFPSILQSIIKMIFMAKEEINIITPYFIPTESIMDALKIAVLSGITVNIIFPEKADHIMVNWASKTYLSELAKCGANIYLFDSNAFIHSKVLTIDNKITNIGTANMDIRSFALNYEINTVIYDNEITNEFNNKFLTLLQSSTKLNSNYYDNLSIFNKLKYSFARLFSELL